MLILMRGLPGSGKSTLSKELSEKHGAKICAVDDYFMVDGEYMFDRKMLPAYHAQNILNVTGLLRKGYSAIADNVNTNYFSCREYLISAALYGHEILIAETKTPWKDDLDELFNRNKHGVPLEVLKKMRAEWETSEHIINCFKKEIKSIGENLISLFEADLKGEIIKCM